MMQPAFLSFDAQPLADALQPYRGERLDLLLAEQDAGHVAELQQQCRRLDIQLSGALFPRLISRHGFHEHGAWLLPRPASHAPLLIPLDPAASTDLQVSTLCDALLPQLAQWPEAAGVPTLFLTFDAMIPNIASLLEGIYLHLADRVNYAGVNAGSGQFRPMPCLFDNHRLLAQAVCCILLPHRSYPLLEHGYQLTAQPMLATSSEGNKIAFIDWQPAFSRYQSLVQQQFQQRLTPDQFYQYGVHLPLGLLRANGDVIVRIPVAVTEEGALLCVGEVPDHSILTLLKAPQSPTAHAIELAEKLSRHGAPERLEIYYCAGRQQHFGEQSTLELKTLFSHSGAHELVGALSLGEIGSLRPGEYPLFHNGAILCNGEGRR
ncbi:FIST signal transduction protein [Aeromonas dhakensis]|uniref:FIST signal transduction protein n=1 Tax=Aeromonas dhakensis TaxID=196024 RepID=UPI001BFCBF1B|nr:FIST C-terminal domain-containing protein [Aeromonas dhakensis]HDT5887407.1 FIST C-terminal domain-containing protein [Aeromonas dhakensis]HEB4977077.1 FIST C-terminal domain-containing protein [Aeromonas dhakensis]